MTISLGYVRVNKSRAERYYQAKNMVYKTTCDMSPKASIWSGITIGENCKIADNCMIAPFSHIEDSVFIGTGSIIGHHTTIQDHCDLLASVRISGYVLVE